MLTNGSYYDPAVNGQGVDVYVLNQQGGGTLFVAGLKLGRVRGHYTCPVWLSVQQNFAGPLPATWQSPLYEIRDAEFGGSSGSGAYAPTQVGTATFTVRSDNAFDVALDITGDGQPRFSPDEPLPRVRGTLRCVRLI